MEQNLLTDHVLTAAANTYRWSDLGPVEIRSAPSLATHDIFLPRLRRYEKICIEAADIENIEFAVFEEYRTSGVEVWVVVPLSSMGKAHRVFRGRADRIQGWWLDGSSKIRFGKAETP